MASHLDLEEQEQLDQLKAFWKSYGNLITTVITLCLLAFAGWNGWNWWQREQAVKAGAMFEELDRAAQAGDVDKVGRAFSDLKERHPGTSYAAQGALLAAKLQLDKGQSEPARAALSWAVEKASETEYRDIARLRLAALQMDAKQYDEAVKTLDGVKGADFAALVADRRGDLALLQGKPDAAKAEFLKAYKGLDKGLDYRRLVEAKLATLGVAAPEDAASGAAR
ncbi:YfgM family protein [Roseateles sp.]|jgi:predicted negative regulator of RcsB-dependent stress response|uniref:YfgM family protein n=1 Tax=Roseateles sp. TaxID=1971397 RepID=UPI003918C4C5